MRAIGTRGWKRKVPGGPATPSAAVAAPAPSAAASAPTRIEPGCEIEGKLTLKGPLVVEGEFRGEIVCRGDVLVTEDGTVQANIRGRTVVIRGAVVGDVEASRELLVAPSGRLHGAARTPSLVIERGAFFQGATRMYRPEQLARAAADGVAVRDAASVIPAPQAPGR